LKYDNNNDNNDNNNKPIKSFNYDELNTNNILSHTNISNNTYSITDNINNNNNKVEINENSIENIHSTNDIWNKLKKLKLDLHVNNISDKRSACFWCTFDFDNPPIFIPKHKFNSTYKVYGCFCSPQCSCAYLMNEKIDSSIKFERYQLLNNIYGKIYNYVTNIKPSPNPYYLLDKYYGTLTINEYRNLFKNDKLLIIVDKPLTHVFPELYEDNFDFILNNRTIPSNSTYNVKNNNINKKKNIFDSLTKKNNT
jgi:hypothetical protein